MTAPTLEAGWAPGMPMHSRDGVYAVRRLLQLLYDGSDHHPQRCWCLGPARGMGTARHTPAEPVPRFDRPLHEQPLPDDRRWAA